MLKFFLRLPALLALSVAASGVRAQAIGDPKQGLGAVGSTDLLAMSRDRVAEQDRSRNAHAPRFVDLAAASGMTNAALLVALTTPHAGMPMFTFTKEQRDDIIAYILSLH